MRVLYLSYDGALDPLGRSQVLPYVRTLSRRGLQYDLISFEKPERSGADHDALRNQLMAEGVNWHPHHYHRRMSAAATAFDLFAGLRTAQRLHRIDPFDLVHVRSYPCATIALALKRRFGVPYLFDMRGFYPEERVDGGLWRQSGTLFRLAKRLESEFLREAAAVVTLTHASVPALRAMMRRAGSRAAVAVIPTAVDLDRFVPAPVVEPRRIVYLGSLGTWYRVEVMELFARSLLAIDRSVRVEFLVNSDGSTLASLVAEAGGRVVVRSVPFEQVPEALAGAAATFSVIDPAPSKVASAPTKVGESLAAGLPVLSNRGVGDVARWIDEAAVGVVLESLDRRGVDDAAEALLRKSAEPGISQRCRTFAEEYLSLDAAGDAYEGLYRALARPASQAVS